MNDITDEHWHFLDSTLIKFSVYTIEDVLSATRIYLEECEFDSVYLQGVQFAQIVLSEYMKLAQLIKDDIISNSSSDFPSDLRFMCSDNLLRCIHEAMGGRWDNARKIAKKKESPYRWKIKK